MLKPKSKKSLTVFLIIFLILIISIITIFFLKYSQSKKIIDLKIKEEISKLIGRKITIESLSYSYIKGLIIKNACIKEKDSQKDFFCSKETIIKIDTLSAIKNKLVFSDVSFSGAKLILRKLDKSWNFDDLIELLPKNNKPLHLNWNAKNFSFKDSAIFINTGENEIALLNSNIELNHRSKIGGNFSLKLDSILTAYINNNFFSANTNSVYDLNFNYSKLDSISGKTSLKKIALKDITAENFNIETEIFKISEKKSERKIYINSNLTGLLIPNQNKIYGNIKEKTNILESILGKTLYPQNELYISKANFTSNLKNNYAINKLEIDSNFIYLFLESDINITELKHYIKLNLKSMNNEIKLESNSTINNPKPQPSFSETIDKYLKESIINLEKLILNKFTENKQGRQK